MLRGVILWWCWLFLVPLWSQVDTIVTFDSVVVVARPIRVNDLGGKSVSFKPQVDFWTPPGSLAGLTFSSNLAFVKSYGSGSLATTSFRGGNAGQTLVLWNGLPLQSPMLGQLDFSLLPNRFAEKIALRPGGSSSLWGSGAVAGSLALDNGFPESPSFSLDTQIGSFGRFSENIYWSAGRKRFRSVTRLLYENAKNDFPYPPFVGAAEIRLKNAATRQQGILQSLQYTFDRNRELIVHLWHQFTDRLIPPLLSQSESLAAQQDRATRLALIFKHQHDRSIGEFKLAYFDEQNAYQDPIIGIDQLNAFDSWLMDYNHDWSIKPHWRFSLGSTFTFTTAEAGAYNSGVSEYQGAIFAGTRFDIKRFTVLAALRKQWVEQQRVPLIPLISMEYRLNPLFLLKAKFSRDYRLPTLNDRFWMPGGHPALRSENGWSQEAGFMFLQKLHGFSWKYEGTAYNRLIHDWIIWLRKEGQVFFSPANIGKVWSRGLEQQLNLSYSWKQNRYHAALDLSYSVIKSTNEVEITNPVAPKGQQLIYTPGQQGAAGLSLRFDQIGLSYRQIYTGGYRGINQDLADYQVGMLDVTAHLRLLQMPTRWFIKIENVWDDTYQVIENRPMPGRNYQAGVKMEWFFKEKK